MTRGEHYLPKSRNQSELTKEILNSLVNTFANIDDS